MSSKLILTATSQKKSLVFIGQNLEKEIREFIEKTKPTKTVFVTDDILIKYLNKYIKLKGGKNFILKPGEKEKNLNNLRNLIDFFYEHNLDKKSLVIGFGGGVITDLVGFAGSIYNRGIPVAFIPTTLLAQVDASIGGKNTINYNQTKNIIGNIYQPQAVFIDIKHLQSLPNRQFNSGLAEIIKYGIGFDKDLFNLLIKFNEIKEKELIDLIARSVQIKINIVEKDQDETQGSRKLLNFGHTLGHALESQNLNLTHGEAVAIGLHFSCFVAKQLENITLEDLKIITDLLKRHNLPIFAEFEAEQVIKKMAFDKKKSGDTIDFITLKNIGTTYIHKINIGKLKKYLYQFKKTTTLSRP